MIKENYFTGFEKSYIFFDPELDYLYVFQENGIVDISENDKVSLQGKWRFSVKKQLLEIFIKEDDKKIFYQIKEINKTDSSDIIDTVCLIKINDEKIDKKEVKIARNEIDSDFIDGKKLKPIDNIIIGSLSIFTFLLLVLIAFILPVFNNVGFLYLTCLSFVLTVVMLKPIMFISSKISKKYGESLEKLFY